MISPVRYATIGRSWIADAFIKGSELSGHLQLSAVYSRNINRAREFAAPYGCGLCFDDLQKMAESDQIDAVYIASPNICHYSQSKLFLENGKHVICEKPITVRLKEYLELEALAEKNGLVYMDAFMMLHHPEANKIKQAIQRLGQITSARLDFSQFSSKYQQMKDGKTPNIFNPEMGAGCLMDMGVYCIYPALEWFGVPDEVVARAGFVQTGADGFINALFVYPDKHVDISLSKTGQSRIGCEIMGDKGTLTIGFIVLMEDIWLYSTDGKKEEVVRNYSRSEMMHAEGLSFYRYIREKEASISAYEHTKKLARQAYAVVEQIRETAKISV